MKEIIVVVDHHITVEGIEDSTVSVTMGNNSEYYWIVEAVDKDSLITLSNDGQPMRMVVGTLDIDELEQIPTEFALHQNYPNPFNPITRLDFDLPQAVHVNLIVYDIMGREVMTIINESMNPGYHYIVWAGQNNRGQQVPTGIYIARLVTGEFTKSIKMAFLK